MKEPRKDDERLSALLDGRLHERERDELLTHLAASDDDYEVFADTAAVLRAAEAGVVPLRPPRPLAQWGALAAVLVGLTVAGVLAWRGRASAAADPVRLAASLAHAGDGLPEGWTERPRWSSVRGGGAPAAMTPGERAAQGARAGALLMDLSVAVRARDAADTRLLSEQVRSRFDPGSGRAGPLRQVAQRAGEPPEALAPRLAQATDRIAGRLGREPLRLGAWTEAARLAAHRRDEAFFRAGASRAMLRQAERLTRDDPAARAAVERLRGVLPAEGTPAWDALEGALDALLREIAS